MRVMHCLHSCNPEGGGVWQAVLQFSLELIRQGHETLAVTTDQPLAPWCKNTEIPVVPMGPPYNRYGYAPDLKYWLKIHAKEYDCAIIHGLWQYHGRAALKILPKLRVPYFIYPHGMLDPWFKQAYPVKHLKKLIYWKLNEARLFQKAKAVLFTCEEERLLAQSTFHPYKCRETVASLGIEVPTGNPDLQEKTFLDHHPQLERKKYILFLSRIHEKKGLDLLLKAIAKLESPPPPLVIAGPVESPTHLEDLRKLEAEIVDRHKNWRIIWTGMLTGNLKWGALRSAGAFVLPSHQENFGIAVIEALAMGTPVLLSNKVNIWREIVDDGAGFAGPDTEDGTLAVLQDWLALDARARMDMQKQATQSFNKRFNIQSAVRHLTEVLAA